MLYNAFLNHYVSASRNVAEYDSSIAPLQIYNEIKYAYLNNLDYKSEKGILNFPVKAHSAAVNSLDLDPRYSRYLLSGSADSSVKLWDLQQEIEEDNSDEAAIYKPLVVLPRKSVHSFGVTNVRWWPDNGMCLSSSYDFSLNLYDASTMEVAHKFKPGSRVLHFDFFKHCDRSEASSIVSCCLDGGFGGVKLIDLRTLSDTHTLGAGGELNGGVGYMTTSIWSPTNPYLCIGGASDGSCYGWDIRSSKNFLFELDSNQTEHNIKRRKLNSSFKKNKVLKSKAHHAAINSMLFTESGDELITLGLDDKIHVWNMNYSSVSRSPINKGLNFGSTLRNNHTQHIDMCLSPSIETESPFLWVPSENGELLVYRIDDGSLVARLNKRHNNPQQRSYSLVCTDSNTSKFYSGCKDGSISIWGYDEKLQQRNDPIHFDNGVDIPEEQPEDMP